jgi:hypothetical protein
MGDLEGRYVSHPCVERRPTRTNRYRQLDDTVGQGSVSYYWTLKIHSQRIDGGAIPLSSVFGYEPQYKS